MGRLLERCRGVALAVTNEGRAPGACWLTACFGKIALTIVITIESVF